MGECPKQQMNDINKIDKKRTLTAIDLILMGVGCIVGAGIFVLSGVAAKMVGPVVVFSFVFSAIACIFTGLCYAELSSKFPISGSVYSYTYMCIGEFIAHLAGWMMISVYILSASAVVSGWSNYFNGFMHDSLGFDLPKFLTIIPSEGGVINLPAFLIAMLVGVLLVKGTSDSKIINNLFVSIKIGVILLFLAVGFSYVNTSNWSPFIDPNNGIWGIFKGASVVFFAYIGFDAISTSAEEVQDPQRNLPIGILGSLIVSTLIYIAVCLILTGMLPYKQLSGNAVAQVLYVVNQGTVASIVSIGAMIGMLAGIFAFMYASSRIIFAMSRDGLLPHKLAKENRNNAPYNAIILVVIVIAILAGTVNTQPLAELANIGVFIAFLLVGICVIIARTNFPNINPNGFKVPFMYVVVVCNSICCLFLLYNLPAITWLALSIWLIMGAIIYVTFSKKHIRIKQNQK